MITKNAAHAKTITDLHLFQIATHHNIKYNYVHLIIEGLLFKDKKLIYNTVYTAAHENKKINIEKLLNDCKKLTGYF